MFFFISYVIHLSWYLWKFKVPLKIKFNIVLVLSFTKETYVMIHAFIFQCLMLLLLLSYVIKILMVQHVITTFFFFFFFPFYSHDLCFGLILLNAYFVSSSTTIKILELELMFAVLHTPTFLYSYCKLYQLSLTYLPVTTYSDNSGWILYSGNDWRALRFLVFKYIVFDSPSLSLWYSTAVHATLLDGTPCTVEHLQYMWRRIKKWAVVTPS